MKIDFPDTFQFTTQDGSLTPSAMAYLTKVRDFINTRSQSGTTAQRPTKRVEIGTTYFDTTLNKPIWVKSVSAGVATWCDATGANV